MSRLRSDIWLHQSSLALIRNRTLTGARAERNEYILLHEFHRLKYICPDKGEGKPTSRSAKKVAKDEDGTVIPEQKRAKYQGGLVFEPKRGLWDTYILVMDFNSLYPSIIQEYNIDFTTVERHDDETVSYIYLSPRSWIPRIDTHHFALLFRRSRTRFQRFLEVRSRKVYFPG